MTQRFFYGSILCEGNDPNKGLVDFNIIIYTKYNTNEMQH